MYRESDGKKTRIGEQEYVHGTLVSEKRIRHRRPAAKNIQICGEDEKMTESTLLWLNGTVSTLEKYDAPGDDLNFTHLLPPQRQAGIYMDN